MAVRFTALGSGSSGNASLLEVDGFGLLIDIGLGPRQLSARLATIGANWASISAVALTHTHADHWRERSLVQMSRREIPVLCHSSHAADLRSRSPAFRELDQAGLVRLYRPAPVRVLSSRLVFHPFRLTHDGERTFGFRLERPRDLFGRSWSMAYAADLGSWDAELPALLCGTDLLALEFNHDVSMQRGSGRPRALIDRVLGNRGHLSNEQAATLLGEVLRRSRPGRLKHVVQLHLSRQCNRPHLARRAAHSVLDTCHARVALHTSTPYVGLPIHAGHSDAT